MENIRNEGYIAETHYVTTVDGYILAMHRIPYRKVEYSRKALRPVVLLMPGMTATSNEFVILGPKYAIGKLN